MPRTETVICRRAAVLADHAPALYFAAPKVTVAASARLEGISASALIPPVFWNAEVLHVTGPRR
jgi:hypothetical protein